MQDRTSRNNKYNQADNAADILDSISDGFFALDRGWRFTYINKRAASNLGLEPRDLIGQNIWQRFPGILGTEHEATYRLVMQQGHPREFELHGVLTGSWYNIRVYPAAEGISVYWLDITERMKAEAALRESQARHERIVRNANEGIWLVDKLNRTVFINQQGAGMLGYAPEEMMGRSPVEFVPPGCQERGERELASRKAGVSTHAEHCLQHKTGSEVWVYSNTVPVYDDEGEYDGALAMFSDITTRKKAEDDLRAKEEKYRGLFNAMTEGFGLCRAVYDNHGKLCDLVFEDINPAAETAAGASKEQIVGKTFRQLWPENHYWYEACDKVLSAGESVRYEVRGINGRWYDVHQFGIGKDIVATVFADITESKKAESVVQLERIKLANILNALEDAVCIVSRNFEVEYVNPAMQSLYGDVAGQKCYQYFNKLDRVCSWCNNEDVFAGSKLRREVWSKRAGRAYEIVHTPLRNEDGSTSKMSIFHDITARKKTEAVKDEFLSLVSHEMKTPLTIMLGGLHTLVTEGKRLTTRERTGLLQDAYLEAGSLADIVSNLLELSRYQAGRLSLANETVDMQPLLRHMVRRAKEQHPGHRFIVQRGRLPVVKADRVRLERIVYNLLDNAAKYSPEKSIVRVTAARNGVELVVGVSDQGEGISLENQDKLFQPFERLGRDATGKAGSGIGLVVCKRLVEAHGGKIWVESRPGCGSTFYFTLSLNARAQNTSQD